MLLKQTYKLILFLLLVQNSDAQQLIENTKLSFQLKDGTVLNCYNPYSMNGETNNTYYYLPTNIHFVNVQSGEKSYALLVYKDENEQIKGGIMHWILSWGLNSAQNEEAIAILKSKRGSSANLIGAVLSEKDQSKADFQIMGTNQLSKILNTALVERGSVPLVSNAKLAVAFKFTKEEAKSINDLFTRYNEQKETSIQMQFLVTFKKQNGKNYKKNVLIKQNLQALIAY